MTYKDLTKGRFSQKNNEYLITVVTHNRTPIFLDFYVARILINEFKHQQSLNHATWMTWVIMPDHFHILISLKDLSLAMLMQNIKGRTARKINLFNKTNGKIWQKGFHDRCLRCEEDRLNISRYIVANPLRAKLVSKITNYPHWDSIWL